MGCGRVSKEMLGKKQQLRRGLQVTSCTGQDSPDSTNCINTLNNKKRTTKLSFGHKMD